MVYKKYIKKRGKTYGPYYYRSRKENGRVITEYVGMSDPSSKKSFSWLFILGTVTLIFVLGALFINLSFTGMVSSDIQTKYRAGELLKGTLKFSLKEGELIPADAKVIVAFGSETREYFLSDLVNENTTSGRYYIENLGILGEGVGYGVMGSKRIYPNVSFQLEIIDEGLDEGVEIIETNVSEVTEENKTVVSEETNETEGIVNETEISESNETVTENETETFESNETISNEEVNETKESSVVEESEGLEETQEPTEKVEEQEETEVEEVSVEETESSEQEVEGGSAITGEVIADYSDFILGIVSKGNKFEYPLSVTKDARLVKGSVEVEGEQIPDDSITIKNKKKKVVVTTDYSYEEGGFGEEYLSRNSKLKLKINLNDFNLSVNNDSDLHVYLVYGNTTITSISKEISLVNESIDEEYLNETLVNETLINETEILNETNINVSVTENISTIQYGAVIGKPVKWKKIVQVDKVKSLKVEIPKEAENITVYKLNEVIEDVENKTVVSEETNETEGIVNETETFESNETISNEEVNEASAEKKTALTKNKKVSSLVTGQFVKGIDKTRINAKVISGEISAEVTLEEDSVIIGFFKRLLDSITGRVVDVKDSQEIKEVVIEENATEFEIEYTTPAPVALEENTSFGKRVVISSDVHYENILAYTELPYAVPEWQIKLYRTTNGTRELVDFIGYTDEEDEVAKQNLDNLTNVEGDKIVANRTSHNLNCTSGNNTNQNKCAKTKNVATEKLITYIEWIVPHLSNQSYELELTILNVQSYPIVGGNWTVRFNTTGTANLTINPINGTTWINESEYNYFIENNLSDNITEDLVYLETKCGENSEKLNYSWIDVNYSYEGENITTKAVFIQNYSCNNDTGYHIVRVLTEGSHHQKFQFGNETGYAHNWAKAGNVYNCSSCSDCNAAIADASAGDIVMLVANITNQDGNCVEFNGADNITFDCNGYIINGDDDTTGYGIYLNDSSDNTIRNCANISYFSSGLRIDSSDSNTLTNITASNNQWSGLHIYDSTNNTLTNITITTTGNQGGLYAFGNSTHRNDIDHSVTVDGKPVQYFDGYYKLNIHRRRLSFQYAQFKDI